MSDHDRSLTVLIQEMLDGVLDDDQRADLLKRVESDDAARKLYLDQIATHMALKAVLAECLAKPEGNPKRKRGTVDPDRSLAHASGYQKQVLTYMALATTIMLLVCGIGYLWIAALYQSQLFFSQLSSVASVYASSRNRFSAHFVKSR